MTKPIARDPMYRKRVFDADIIELCVRWYITYRLSYRDLVEMMAERGVKVAHSTILRWVTRYVPEFEKRWSRFSKAVGEWLPNGILKLRVSESKSANARVNRLARWLQVPRYRGRPWRFSSHQGRKTFARFVALRDRTALYALAQHLGYRDIRQTDQSYVGTDYQLNSEIDAAVIDESIAAWEQMLSATTLAGRMGAEVLARRPRFRGARVKQEIRAYARMLTDSGLTLGVCEWG